VKRYAPKSRAPYGEWTSKDNHRNEKLSQIWEFSIYQNNCGWIHFPLINKIFNLFVFKQDFQKSLSKFWTIKLNCHWIIFDFSVHNNYLGQFSKDIQLKMWSTRKSGTFYDVNNSNFISNFKELRMIAKTEKNPFLGVKLRISSYDHRRDRNESIFVGHGRSRKIFFDFVELLFRDSKLPLLSPLLTILNHLTPFQGGSSCFASLRQKRSKRDTCPVSPTCGLFRQWMGKASTNYSKQPLYWDTTTHLRSKLSKLQFQDWRLTWERKKAAAAKIHLKTTTQSDF
jgi:hypothetical protein